MQRPSKLEAAARCSTSNARAFKVCRAAFRRSKTAAAAYHHQLASIFLVDAMHSVLNMFLFYIKKCKIIVVPYKNWVENDKNKINLKFPRSLLSCERGNSAENEAGKMLFFIFC